MQFFADSFCKQGRIKKIGSLYFNPILHGGGGRRQTPQMSPDFMTLLHQYSKGPVEVVFQNKKIENFENLKKSFLLRNLRKKSKEI